MDVDKVLLKSVSLFEQCALKRLTCLPINDIMSLLVVMRNMYPAGIHAGITYRNIDVIQKADRCSDDRRVGRSKRLDEC